ncbi:polysaccharide biosynthesis protein [Archaeoglobus veneficus SNP6]|uniref:Polysaccharide biosynthesis protein n=1 Tax=Archaeoglobus veneficus (strain DSM 11195 / SNP6) TaxID=693661 RepID=F2KQE3_ARCVS|nr:polysaccharide biosynthesis protein [Archaeoglobus veneficus SNP6]
MGDTVGDSLRRVAKGAAIFFIGSIVGLFIAFIGRIIVVRYVSPSQFGVLSLSLVVFTILCTIASMGLPEGLTRQASYFLGKKDLEKVKAVFGAGIYLSTISGLLAAAGLFALSDVLAEFFGMPDVSWTLKIFSFALPVAMLNRTLVSIFRTYERADVKVIFSDLLPNTLRVAFIVAMVILSMSFYWVVMAYFFSIVISGIVFLTYSLRNVEFKTSESVFKYFKILIFFSLPLLIQSILGMLITWTDTLMIGYYLASSDVGLYNGAQPLAGLMQNFLASVSFLYFPIVSQLYARNQLREMGRTYAVVTKWLMSASLPIFLVLFFFPDAVLWLLYGEAYVPAAYALRALALGFFTHVMLGPNGLTLIAAGEAKFPTIAGFIAAVINFVLNLILIPLFGITGAAIASASTYATANAMISLKLYKDYKIHPFTKNYVKPAFISLAVALLIYLISKTLIQVEGWMLPVLFILFVVIYLLSLLFTRSFDQEDVMIMLSIEQRLGVDLTWAKRVLKRFV